MLLILALLLFMFNNKKLKRTESFNAIINVGLPSQYPTTSPPVIAPEKNVYYKRNNNIANIEYRCFSKETKKYIWKQEWNALDTSEEDGALYNLWLNKFKDRGYENFSTWSEDAAAPAGKLMLENNAAKCRNECKNSTTNCHGYSIRYRKNEAIRCLLHYGDITHLCGRNNMNCLQIKKDTNLEDGSTSTHTSTSGIDDNNITCKNKKSKNDEDDDDEEEDIMVQTKNNLPIYRDLFDKLDSDDSAAFKDKFIQSETQPINKDIPTVEKCGFECMSHFMSPNSCFGFIFNSTSSKCTILKKK